MESFREGVAIADFDGNDFGEQNQQLPVRIFSFFFFRPWPRATADPEASISSENQEYS